MDSNLKSTWFAVLLVPISMQMLFGCAKPTVTAIPRRSAPQLDLKYNVKPQTTVYKVHRTWRTEPRGIGFGNQNHDFTVVYKWTRDGNNLKASIAPSNFVGKDLDSPEDRAHRDSTSDIEKMILGQGYDEHGPRGLFISTIPVAAGKVGQMVQRAIGLDEVGFLSLHYPDQPIRLNQEWVTKVDIGTQGITPTTNAVVTGSPADCKCRLLYFNTFKSEATISFTIDTSLVAKFPDPTTKAERTLALKVFHTGIWVVDITTGLPKTFSTSKVIIESEENRSATEKTETTVNLVSVLKT